MPTDWGLPLVRGEGGDGSRKVVTYLPNRFHAHRHLDHSSYSLVVPPSFPPSANCTMPIGHAIFLLPPPDRLFSVPTLILTCYYLGRLHRDNSSYPAALNGYPHSAGCHTSTNDRPPYAPQRKALFCFVV